MATQTVSLNKVQQRILDSLGEEGFARTDVRELFGEQLWREVRADAAPWIEACKAKMESLGPKPKHKDDFIFRRFEDAEPRVPFTLDSPWLRIGLSDELLVPINAYRGLQTKLNYFDNWFTPPYPASDSRVGSQRWHRDFEEEHIVKVFLYLEDVPDEAGPFEYVRSSTTGQRYGDLWPFGGKVKHPPEHKFAMSVAPEDRVHMTGPAGTMLFADVGGWHRGGFAKKDFRAVSLWSYVSPDIGEEHRFAFDLEGRESELSSDAQAALA